MKGSVNNLQLSNSIPPSDSTNEIQYKSKSTDNQWSVFKLFDLIFNLI